jgi:hypothetical protein
MACYRFQCVRDKQIGDEERFRVGTNINRLKTITFGVAAQCCWNAEVGGPSYSSSILACPSGTNRFAWKERFLCHRVLAQRTRIGWVDHQGGVFGPWTSRPYRSLVAGHPALLAAARSWSRIDSRGRGPPNTHLSHRGFGREMTHLPAEVVAQRAGPPNRSQQMWPAFCNYLYSK